MVDGWAHGHADGQMYGERDGRVDTDARVGTRMLVDRWVGGWTEIQN